MIIGNVFFKLVNVAYAIFRCRHAYNNYLQDL